MNRSSRWSPLAGLALPALVAALFVGCPSPQTPECAVPSESAQPCYSGPAGTQDVGRCKAGHIGCAEDGFTSACLDEVLPAEAETCNGLDDDCNGTADDGFDLQTSDANCGSCGHACAATERCVAGSCLVPSETSCSNRADDDGDDKIDCADEECATASCGDGCTCAAGGMTETGCVDGNDNDGDGQKDCMDSDCVDNGCGAGCACVSSTATETACGDGVDNDNNGGQDCADSDCNGQSCGVDCTCTGGVAKELSCSDDADNDRDGNKDCADSDCNAQSCGTGCVCTGGNRREMLCSDGGDNDGDTKPDCQDSDCLGLFCGVGTGGMPATCRSGGLCL